MLARVAIQLPLETLNHRGNMIKAYIKGEIILESVRRSSDLHTQEEKQLGNCKFAFDCDPEADPSISIDVMENRSEIEMRDLVDVIQGAIEDNFRIWEMYAARQLDPEDLDITPANYKPATTEVI